MQHKDLKAKVRVYSVTGEDYLVYKFKGKYYPIPLVAEDETDNKEMEVHTAPCPYRAAMVAQSQYAPFYSKQLKEIGKKNFTLLTVFTL